MEEEYKIRCMRHCDNRFNIFYIAFPKICPICKSKIETSTVLPPFCVPHPFISSSQAPWSVVVKPTDGCFLKTYQSGNDLHIGLVSSKGLVHSFNENGCHVEDSTNWSLCISVNLADILKRHSCEFSYFEWDQLLEKHCDHLQWSADKYEANTNNCYDFVFAFLRDNFLLSQEFANKEAFCTRYILPEAKKAAKYVDLYRCIIDNGTTVSRVCHSSYT